MISSKSSILLLHSLSVERTQDFGKVGRGGRKFENNEDKRKNFSTQNRSVFLPKIR